jgi:predicted thioesterase
MWRRKPKVVATGVLVGLLEWSAMEALRPFLARQEDVLGTSVDDFGHRAPAFRGDTLLLTATCSSVHGPYSVWRVNAYRGSQSIAYGYVGFHSVQVEAFVRRWIPASPWRRFRVRPRWIHRVWLTLCLIIRRGGPGEVIGGG